MTPNLLRILAIFMVVFALSHCAQLNESGYHVEGSIVTPGGLRVTADGDRRIIVDVDTRQWLNREETEIRFEK